MSSPLFFRDVERQASRMGELIQRLDVDTLKLVCRDEGKAYAQARTTCFDCSNATKCLQWLDDATGEASPTFCPNLPLFASCKRR